MASPYQTIDYINTVFEYLTLQKIRGQSFFASLTKINKQLKANVQLVVSNLGGGAHGHLGLVLTPEKYVAISVKPSIELQHPGAFNIQRNTEATQAIQQRETHNERIHRIQETQNV